MRNISILALIVLGFAAPPLHADIIAISNFDDPPAGVDGWTVIGDVASGPTRIAAGGNPGGFLRLVDSVVGDVIYWNAPGKFLGNKSSAYGFNLTFDLRQSSTDSQFDDDDVVLIGGALTLVYDTSPNPATAWTSYLVPLLASAGWKVGSLSGAAATEAQMQTVLGGLTAMRIRAEYRSGADTDDIDNIVLNGATAVPEPSTLFLTSGGLLFIIARHRRLSRNRNRSDSC